MSDAEVDESETNDPQTLIDAQTRRGLCKVGEECQNIFIRVEEKFKAETTVKHLRKIDYNKMTHEITSNTDVVDFYNSIIFKSEVNVDTEVSDNLLESMIRLYIRVRSFSLTRDITALYKQKSKAKGQEK